MKQATKAAQQELLNIDQNLKSEVSIPRSKKKYRVGWLKPYTTNKISKTVLENEAPETGSVTDFISKKSTVIAKISAYIILNNFWTITFFHGIFWRWLFYVRQFDYDQLYPIVVEGKKKMPQDGFYISMALAASMMDTMRTMMKEEAEQYLRELSSGQDQPSEKSILGH